MKIQILKRHYTCQHKTILRKFIIRDGSYFEEIPSCVEDGCHGYQMLRITLERDNEPEEPNELIPADAVNYWDRVYRR